MVMADTYFINSFANVFLSIIYQKTYLIQNDEKQTCRGKIIIKVILFDVFSNTMRVREMKTKI